MVRGALPRQTPCGGAEPACGPTWADAAGRRTVKQLPNGAVSYFGYDAASRQTSILNVESDMTPVSSVAYEWNADGLPTVQRRRGDYDVEREQKRGAPRPGRGKPAPLRANASRGERRAGRTTARELT